MNAAQRLLSEWLTPAARYAARLPHLIALRTEDAIAYAIHYTAAAKGWRAVKEHVVEVFGLRYFDQSRRGQGHGVRSLANA